MIRPTETWQPQRDDVGSRLALEPNVALLRDNRDWQTPIPLRVDLPAPSVSRDFNQLAQVVKTSLPLWLADQWCVLITVSVAGLLVEGLAARQLMFALAAALTVANGLLGLYPGVGLNAIGELRQTSKAVTLVAVAIGIAGWILGGVPAQTGWGLILASAGCLVLIPLTRRIARRVASRFRWWGQPTLVFGFGDEGAAAYGNLLRRPQLGLRPVGLVESRQLHRGDPTRQPNWCLVPAHSSTEPYLRSVFWGVVAMPHRELPGLAASLDEIAGSLPHLLVLPHLSTAGRQWNGAISWDNLSAARIDAQLLLPGPRFLKRLMDVAITSVVGLTLIPLFVLIVLLIKLTSTGPCLYRHERIGRNGRRFRAWKFRTMSVDAERILHEYLAQDPELLAEWKATHKLKRDPRVTGIGWFLRKTSLDELPQLWNVLVGDMSLVGPRPIVEAEISKYAEWFDLYCRTRPGITGLWQINGRNNTTYAERVRYDLQYVRNWSPWMDCYILARTVKTVLLTEGAY